MTLEEWRRASNLTYQAIADLIPCSGSYPHMIATGKAQPGYRMAVRIEQVSNGMVPRTNWYPSEETPKIDDVPNISEMLNK